MIVMTSKPKPVIMRKRLKSFSNIPHCEYLTFEFIPYLVIILKCLNAVIVIMFSENIFIYLNSLFQV